MTEWPNINISPVLGSSLAPAIPITVLWNVRLPGHSPLARAGILLGQRRQRQDETPDNRSRQRNGPEGFEDCDCPEWFLVLVKKVLIRHRNLHSQSKPSSVGAPPRLRFVAALPEVDLDLRMNNPCKRDVVILAACLRIVLRQLDLVRAFHMVDGTNMDAIGTHHFHMVLNVETFEHAKTMLTTHSISHEFVRSRCAVELT